MATNSTSTTRGKAARPGTAQARRPNARAKVEIGAPVRVRTKSEAATGRYGTSPRSAMYAYLGAGQVAFEKTREVSGKVVSALRNPQDLTIDLGKVYGDLSARGQEVAQSIRTSAYTRRAMDQTKLARSQIKAATTSVRKAVDTASVAAREAAKKVG